MKRALDITLVVLFIPLWLPLCLVLAMLCAVFLGSPVIFKQTRPGLYGRPFTLYKFRTMTDKWDANHQLLSDDDRFTWFGGLLRRVSLDELPELWNVLKGDMSLVGPRPLLMEYLDRYTPEEARRHEVRPGITGWAQVNGRTAITFVERFKLDVWYVDHQSLWLDIKILLISIWKTVACSGAHKVGEPMEVFRVQKK